MSAITPPTIPGPILSPNRGVFLGHPTGLFLLFLVEMWERFSYYGMRGLLVLYLIRPITGDETGFNPGRGWSRADASTLYGWYTGLAYLFPIFGGLIADKMIGTHRSMLVGGLLIAAGHIVLAISGMGDMAHNATGMSVFVGGLALIVLGTGHFKPSVSVMVGQLYKQGDPRRDGAFTIFYMGINLGAFLCAFVCGTLGEVVGWHWGFGSAAVGMLAGLGLYTWGRPRYLEGIGLPPPGKGGLAPAFILIGVGLSAAFALFYHVDGIGQTGAWVSEQLAKVPAWLFHTILGVAGAATAAGMARSCSRAPTDQQVTLPGVAMAALAMVVLPLLPLILGSLWGLSVPLGVGIAGVFVNLMIWFSLWQPKGDRGPVASIFIFMGFNAFFWLAFEQAGSSINVFTEQNTERHLGSFEVPATWFQSINAGLIFIMAPMFAAMWTALGKRRMNPSQPVKIAFGLIFLGLGFLFMVWAGVIAKGNVAKASMLLIFLTYFWHTVGELFLSPTGLSYVTKAAPVRFVSLLMGIWFISSFIANLGGGLVAAKVEAIEKGELKTPWQFGGQADFFFLFVATSIGAGVLILLLTPLLKKLIGGREANTPAPAH